MRKQTRHRLQIVCGLGILLLLAFLLLVGLTEEKWVGSTTLTIEFIVTDLETGAPIDGAEIFVYDELHTSTNSDESKPCFKTGRDGVVSKTLDQMCWGSSSRFGFNDSRAVRIPAWLVWVKAPGFTQAEPFSLAEHKKTQHVGPSHDKLLVPITLHKSRP